MLLIIFTLSKVFCNIHFFYHFSIVIGFWFRLCGNRGLLSLFTVWIKCFSNLFEVHFCNVGSLNITIDWPLLQYNLFIHYSCFHFINFCFLSVIHFIIFVLRFGDLFSFFSSFFFLFFFYFIFFWNFNTKGSKLICSFIINLIVFFIRGKFDSCFVIDWYNGSIDLHCILCSDTFFWQTCENINHSMEIVMLFEIDVCVELKQESQLVITFSAPNRWNRYITNPGRISSNFAWNITTWHDEFVFWFIQET